MGSTPIGIVLSVTAPESFPVESFKRFLQGVRDASIKFDCPILGGNIKESDRFECVGTALGFSNKNNLLKRSGAKEGDKVIIIGGVNTFLS